MGTTRNSGSVATLFGGIAAIALCAALGAPAAAQVSGALPLPSGDPNLPKEQAAQNDEPSIVVTGTRILRPNLISPVPVTAVTADDLTARGNINIGEALNQLPQMRSTYSQSNSERFIGTSGYNFLDLRGLGTQRTLVMVNGRRHVSSSPGSYLVDTNTIPDDLLERVDIVTGGSSAVYGSDAIAGVVNFVMKRNFQGVMAKGQGSISTYGDHGTYYGVLTAGKNFNEDRGNIAASVEYSHTNALYNVDRDFETGAFSGRRQFNLTTDSSLDGVTGSDGIIDNQYYNGGIRNGTISDGGTLTAICPTTVASGSVLVGRCRASRVRGATANNAERYMFMPDGSLALSQPTIDFRDITNGGSTNTLGGLGSTLNNTGQLQPMLRRISANLLFHYDFSDAFRPYFEGKYVSIRANQEGQPSFIQGQYTTACNNPFLLPSALATLQAIGRCTTPATSTIALSRFNTDFGGRGEIHNRELYRLVGGVEGSFFDTWHYEVSANYGHFKDTARSLNNLLLANFQNAINAVAAPASFTGNNYQLNYAGQRVICSINAVTNVDPGCVPISLFGSGNTTLTPAALNYINTTARNWKGDSELDLTANVSGDLGKLFTLPGGPIQFNIGGEYRKEKAYSYWDSATAAGLTFLNALQPFFPPTLTVKEAFGEINIPLLKDVRFVKELSVSGAGRVSHYNSATGSVYSWNGGAIYAPTRDIKFRANWSQSVRAPTQSDLYSTPSQNFAFINDPCDILYRNSGTPNRAGNCAAAGIPATFVNTPARNASLSYLSGGNANLQAEVSHSFTVGGVITPRWVSGLGISVDYYNIRLQKRIASLSMQTILNQCYDLPQPNQYCGLINPRNADGTFNTTSVGNSAGLNFAKQTTSGIDINISYRKTLPWGDQFDWSGLLTWTFDKTNYLDPTNPNNPDRQLSELGDPMYAAQMTLNYKHGPVTLRYNVRYVGKMTIGTYEAQHEYNGLPPQNADQYPFAWYPAVWYHNLRIGVNVAKRMEFYTGVDNLTNRLPPYGLLATTEGGGIYDNVGRTFYAGFKVSY